MGKVCFFPSIFPFFSPPHLLTVLFFVFFIVIFVQIIRYSIIYLYMYIGKTKSFLCTFSFLFFLIYAPRHFLFSSKFFLFYHQIPQCLLVSVVLHGSDLLIHNNLDAFSVDSEITLMAFLFFLQSYLVDSEFCIKIFLWNPDSQLLSDNILSTICWICIVLLALDTFQAFFHRPLRYVPPMRLSGRHS